MIRRLCVIGVGLIGGSLARDLRRAGVVEEVVGASRNRANLERAVELGVVDRFDTDPARAVAGADMVVLAVPLGAIGPVLGHIRPALAPGAVVTDVGSAKRCVIEAAREALGEVPSWLVPGHPIAGTENSGVEASFEGLFAGRRVLLTPIDGTDREATARVRAMWEVTRAEVLEMDPDHHDEVLAATSHLPHMLAYTLVDVLGSMEERVEIFRFAAGGFRDFTRIASSDPQMWHDICLANRDALVASLERFNDELAAATEAIRRGDGPWVKALFTRAKGLRDRYTESNGREGGGHVGQ
ncbi:MAG: prephenate dehydrogenase/arogenate dehydrogenase family protein [Ectothiorhodospiraceae bacterium]|nr:prephenate dehydrogenase/arogenate dehydrogenase family protein [Chromatiales bacterium]MCP5156891.1 prephenate dehydrogenase/arogenate dehydrogenase family protein [Ectothiorhodospiraceae bacterium]